MLGSEHGTIYLNQRDLDVCYEGEGPVGGGSQGDLYLARSRSAPLGSAIVVVNGMIRFLGSPPPGPGAVCAPVSAHLLKTIERNAGRYFLVFRGSHATLSSGLRRESTQP
jgi:hypothetical protein